MKIGCFVAKLSEEPDDNEFYVNITLNDKYTFTLNEVFLDRESANKVADQLVSELDETPEAEKTEEKFSPWKEDIKH